MTIPSTFRFCWYAFWITSYDALNLLPFIDNARTRIFTRLSGSNDDSNVEDWLASPVAATMKEENQQAGTDGYSVIRQPLSRSNWDPNASPENDVPLMLEEESKPMNGGISWQDQQWWTTKSKTATAKVQTTASKSNLNARRGEREDVEEELDLLKRTFETLDYPIVLRSLSEDYATTMPAKNILADLQPKNRQKYSFEKLAYQPFLSDSVVGSRERYLAVQEMNWILQGRNPESNVEIEQNYFFRNGKGHKETLIGRGVPLSGNSFELEPILHAASKGGIVLDSPELLEISKAMEQMKIIQNWGKALTKIEELDFVQLPKLADCISFNETLFELLKNALDQDGILSGTTFPTVGRLRARVKALRGSILKKLESLVQMPSVQSKLALESGGALFSEINGGRLVIPVKSDSKASSIGIVHDTSRSGRTLYVEPSDIVGPTNELRQAEGELRSEESRVWRYLTQNVLVNQGGLETSIYAIGQLDVVRARLQLGESWKGIIPAVEEEGVIRLWNARHPVLLLRELANIVGSDIELGANRNRGLVLTGPNSGGKTIILKLLGLVALLSRGGVPVPASPGDYDPRVDFFDPILADIGDIQSTTSDLSTFSGHMLVCREVLRNAGENALVLMDELGSGTDPAQGVAIAQALLEALVEKNTRVAITTHYGPLKNLAAADERFAVAGMQFVGGKPTYKLIPGAVGESFALAVAERLQIPQSIISRANELLGEEQRQMGDLIRELEDQKVLLDEKAADMEEKQREMSKMELGLKEQQRKLEQKQLNVRREEARKFAKKLEEKEKVLENILQKLKSDPSRKVLAKSWDEIKFVKRDALNEAENVASVLSRKREAAEAMERTSAEMVPISQLSDLAKPDLKEGDILVVCKKGPLFGRDGTIVKLMGSRIEIRVANMNVSFKLSELALPPKNWSRPSPDSQEINIGRGASRSKAVQKVLDQEQGDKKEWGATTTLHSTSPNDSKSTIRTEANTVDVRGCNLMEAQERIKDKFSMCLMQGRSPVVYILHGHGTGGVLKSKIRQWLRQEEKKLIKAWSPADAVDGGDALTRVQLK